MDFSPGIIDWLNSIAGGPTASTADLLKSTHDYAPTLYQAAVTLHDTAVKPVTAIILSIMFVLMLATTATRMEGDRELGVKIIAATMFKVALVFIVAQNATLILDAIEAVATTIAGGADKVPLAGSLQHAQMGTQYADQIKNAGIGGQMIMFVVLLFPWLVWNVGNIIVSVLIALRFLQLYIMSAFASLPIAFLGHDETKQMGIGYLKRYGSVALSGVLIVICVKLYQAIVGNLDWPAADPGGDMVGFVIANFGTFFVAPAVFIFIVLKANSLAKAILGDG